MAKTTEEQIKKYLDGTMDAWVDKLEADYGTPYPDTVMKDVVLDNLTGADDALRREVNKLKSWFDSKTTGSDPPIRANPRVYFKGNLRPISADKVRTLKDTDYIEVSIEDLAELKLISKSDAEGYKYKLTPFTIEFGGSCSNGEKENQTECEESGGTWNGDASNLVYLGFTHKTLMSSPLAIISLSVKKIKYTKTDGIRLYFHNILKKYEYEKVLAMSITAGNVDFSDIQEAEKHLPDPMHIGNYFSPKDPVSGTSTLSDMREIMSESIRKTQIDYMHSFKDGMVQSAKILVTEPLEEQALCCLFMAFLSSNPKVEAAITYENHKVPMWVGGANDGYWKYVSVPEFLETQQTKLKGFKVILEFLLNFMISDYKVALNPIMINIIAILTNVLYMAMASSVREAQNMTMDTIVDFIEQEKKRLMDEVQKKITEGQDSDAMKSAEAALRCLPLEKVIIMMIRSLIGKESIFNNLISLLARIDTYFKKKATDSMGDLLAVQKKDFSVSPGKSLIKGAIEIIDFLLKLNTDGLMLCNKYHIQNVEDITGAESNPYVDCLFPDGSVASISQNQCIDECGEECIQTCEGGCPPGQMCANGFCVDSTCNPPCAPGMICLEGTCSETDSVGNLASNSDGLGSAFDPLMPGYSPVDYFNQTAGGYDPSIKYSGRIDITGEGVDPLRLLVLQDSDEISKFFTSYLGVNQALASEMSSNAKAGTCMDGLDSDQKNEVTELLKEVGVDI